MHNYSGNHSVDKRQQRSTAEPRFTDQVRARPSGEKCVPGALETLTSPFLFYQASKFDYTWRPGGIIITWELTTPRYDYRCELNGQTIEVSHAMNDLISTWAELCALDGIETGETPADSPVHKIISGGFVATSASQQASSHRCTAPSCCHGGACGLET